MTTPATSIVRCNDGTEIFVDWVYPGAEQSEWVWNRAHWADPATPMDRWLRLHGGRGADQAWEEPGMVAPAMFYRFQFAGPFSYIRMDPYEPSRAGEINARLREVGQRHGNALGFWQGYCEPRIQQACNELATAAPGVPLQWVADRWAYGFHQTFTSTSLLAEAMARLTSLLAEHAKGDVALLAYEVTQGGDNASQMIDAEIWELASMARTMPAVQRIFAASNDDEVLARLRDTDGAAKFVTAFEALIERYGARSQGWDLFTPTWREQPAAPMSLVRAQLASDGVSPVELTERSSARRLAARDQALAELPKKRHGEFEDIVAELHGYVSVREGRAYWQMVITGEVRSLLLRRGEELVRSGSLDHPDDILFLEPDGVEGAAPSDLRRVVRERRREWERWRAVNPPTVIGTPGVTAATAAAAAAAAGPANLRGAPASRGLVTGPARILHSPDDVTRLRSGDVMVCVMTTPAWTPLFGVAGGIITETGGVLSHPAITAREYGIPAVLAVQDATKRIRDGQLVTIDGAAGTVSLHE